MSNIDAVNALITAINFDQFAEIEARHNPDVLFSSFLGPTLHNSVAVGDWYRTFLRDYADCNYTELEYLENGESVAIRATIEAKGYDWRAFSQRVVETYDFVEGGVAERRIYGMLEDLVLDKPSTASLTNAVEFQGGSANATQAAVDGFYAALLSGDKDTALTFLAPKATLIDTVYGIVNGPESIFELSTNIPMPAFGTNRVVRTFAGAKDALVEIAIDPTRPRRADWVRLVDGKIQVIETYWMLREIAVQPESKRRHARQVIMPI
jgi:hypothetical protein